uniref:C2H2-type domain-containing protein n=1 Tax=Stegastes partitus TaxID=144197 RepID=A0A3B5AP01_9TELE
MLGLQGNTSSKVYRCVACSATFTGLASLLVHQASHASAVSKVSPPTPTQQNISQQEPPFASPDSSGEHTSPPTMLPESPSPSFYICDCGEEFHDFGLMLEHKRSHVSPAQLLHPLDNNIVLSSGTGCEKVFPTQHMPFSPVSQTSLALSCPSTSKSPAVELPTITAHKADVSLEDGIAIVTSPQGQCTPPHDDSDKPLDNVSTTAEQMPETVEDMHFRDKTNSIHSSETGLSKSNTLMKMLASAYMKRFPLPQPHNQNENTVGPKQEVVPVHITPQAKTGMPPINDLSIAQLRRLLAKPGIKTKAPSISRILESSKKKIVSLTKTLSPVVVLETRQKLMDPAGNGVYGRYQCGRCRRVFQNLDRLTEHHFLHKKERIKCCRRCKQLIIGRLPLQDNHVCPPLGNKNIQASSSFKNKSPFAQKLVPFHSLNNAKKVFFCPMCKHSYARRWNLKTHRCHGAASALSRQTNTPFQKMFVLRSNSDANTGIEDVTAESQGARSVGVGTEISDRIKVEETSPNSEQSHKDPSLSGNLLKQGEENSWEAEALNNQDTNEGQWTMPLDDEMEMLNAAVKAVNDGEGKKPVSAEHVEMMAHGLRYFVRDGVKRYPCSRCQKTYSRASTLRRHLRLCGFRPRGFGTLAQSGGQGAITLNASSVKPMFSCFVCGKSFNRKDNMMVHRKRCQFQRTMAEAERGNVQQSLPSNATADCPPKEDDGGNWGIMSLPSVLPRRVTCECGAGFTSPRLLLEHLQKHAQESYTCPTCGETVNSWADYEVHLQIHMHPHHQLLKGLQPQKSQPLLLRFHSDGSQPNRRTFNLHRHFHAHEDELMPLTCKECGLTFQHRSSLIKHRNEHKEKEEHFECAECQKIFATADKLRDHSCSNTVEKPYHCPLCRQEFQFKVSVTKHMMMHSLESHYTCQECNQTVPNAVALRIHQRCHNALKPYECPECGMVFKHYSVMEDHRRRHTDNSRSHLCNICGKTFKYSSLLHQHQYLHTGQKPFRCPECGKQFAFAQNMKAHCRQHRLRETISEQPKNTNQSEEPKRTFNCPLCPQTYCVPANLRAHMLIHEAEYEKLERTPRPPKEINKYWEKGHTCPHCPSVYRDESSLNVHLLSVHKSVAQYLEKMAAAPPKKQLAPLSSENIMEDFSHDVYILD